ncbi:helix-turn-helix domain-containing protein [Glutamicibacter creatinolyticus]|uniref:helix-turn-helix domain-containing protein n=1 Tax=Glutamicibacter creatinolyticus TaxID=162496 RepID=UPI003217D74E
MESIDVSVGANLKEFRGSMPQAELARRMTDRGFKWSQATVYEVERGGRPLKLSEALELAEVLGIVPEQLWSGSVEGRAAREALKAHREWQEILTKIREDAVRFEAIRQSLGRRAFRLMKLIGPDDPLWEHTKKMSRVSKLKLQEALQLLEKEEKEQRVHLARELLAAEEGKNGVD